MGKEDKEKKTDKEKKEEGIAGEILKGIGKIIPGLGGLIESVGKSPAFKERLKKIDEEVERKLREEPLKRTGERRAQLSGRFGKRPLARGSSAGTVRKETAPPVRKEKPVDIFDEGDHIKVIAEMPGVEESDIKIDLVKDNFVISVDTPDHKYRQELKLPCEPKGKIEKTYKNGILEIKITKA